MDFIFDDAFKLIGEFACELSDKIRNSAKSVKMSCFLIIGVICVLVGLVSAGATVAYKVSIEGEVIATVKNKQQYTAALDIVKERVDGIDVESTVSEPEYSPAVVLNTVIDTDEVVADAIIETTDEIVSAVAISVNGQRVAVAEDFGIEAAIEEYKNSFCSEDGDVSALSETVELETVYSLTDELNTREEVQSVISGLTVVTEKTVVSEVEIPYTTTYKKVSTRLIGESVTVTNGVSGLRRVTEKVTLVNGAETARETLSDETLSEPTAAVVEVGTAKSTATAAQKAKAYSSGFIFPLPSGSWRISSYYGDGRNHKGVDLCASKGTAIYAVKGGTVTFAGYDGAYGYSVVINHGNGVSTRYAHASTLCVSVGETVSAGDAVAKVGSTGRSSGNHLHFEVLINGSQVDPAPYIGID